MMRTMSRPSIGGKGPATVSRQSQRSRSRSRERSDDDTEDTTVVSSPSEAPILPLAAVVIHKPIGASVAAVSSQVDSTAGTMSVVAAYHVEVSSIATGCRIEGVWVTHSFFQTKTAALTYAYEQAKEKFEEYRQVKETDEQQKAKVYEVDPATNELLLSDEGRYLFPAPYYTCWGESITTTPIQFDFTKEMFAQFGYNDGC